MPADHRRALRRHAARAGGDARRQHGLRRGLPLRQPDDDGHAKARCATAAPARAPCGARRHHVPGGLARRPGAGWAAGAEPERRRRSTGPEVGLIVKFNDEQPDLGRPARRATGPTPCASACPISTSSPSTPTPRRRSRPPPFAHVGTVLFNMLVNPANGKVYVTNTEARNEVRFEGPGNGGSTVRGHLHEARITVIDGANVLPRHLNKHITALPMGYRTVPMTAGVDGRQPGDAARHGGDERRARSTSPPSARARSASSTPRSSRATRSRPTPPTTSQLSGGGPTGLVLDETNDRLYVFTRFDNSVTVVNTTTNAEIAQHSLYNPEPAERRQRPARSLRRPLHLEQRRGVVLELPHLRRLRQPGWDLGNPDDVVRRTTPTRSARSSASTPDRSIR